MFELTWLSQGLMLLPGLCAWVFGSADFGANVAGNIYANLVIEGGKGAWARWRKGRKRLNQDVIRAIRLAQLNSLLEFSRVRSSDFLSDFDAAQFNSAVED